MTGQESEVRHTATFPLLAAVTLASVIFGDYAQDIGRWIVCWDGGGCSGTSRRGAVMLGAFVGTLVAMLSALQAARIGKQTARETRLVILGAMAGTLLALLKASEDEALGHPVFDRDMMQALFIYAATASVFLVPLMFPEAVGPAQDGPMRLLSVMALVLLIAAVLGTLLQLAAEHVWVGSNDQSSSRKFVIAPVATVMGTAVFGRLMLFPWFSQSAPDWRWLFKWLGYGLILSCAFVLIVYEIRHGLGSPTGWLNKAPSYVLIRIAIAALLFTPLIAFAVAPLCSARRPWLGVLVMSLCAAPVAGFAASHVVDVRIAGNHVDPADWQNFIAVHAASPVVAAVSICLTGPIFNWVSRRFGKSK